jgi:dTDP-4-amino-4,6-dideoxygalactose transaminase
MQIPFLSFDQMNADVKQETLVSFEHFFDSKWYVLGKQVIQFEQDYAAFNQTSFSVGVANGLDALIIALKTLNIGSGDEVIVPSNTYIASWLAVSYVGAKPIPVEPRMETYNINPTLIEANITANTKAIMPVHLYGQCCEMDTIMAVALKHNLYVVEDNAQSQGASFNGKPAGSFGHINGTSFYPGKNLGAFGDAGAITTSQPELAERAKVIRNYGSEKKYYNSELGINSRLDEIQAGFLSIKLKHLADWNTERNQIASWYQEQLSNIPQLVLPVIAHGANSVYHLFVVRSQQRDSLQLYLTENGIGTLIHYPVPPHLQEAYQSLGYQQGDFPIAEEMAATSLSLPMYPGLTKEAVDFICMTIKQFFHA